MLLQKNILAAISPVGFRVQDRKSTRLNSSHGYISYAVFCLKKKKSSSLSHRPGVRRDTIHTYRCLRTDVAWGAGSREHTLACGRRGRRAPDDLRAWPSERHA